MWIITESEIVRLNAAKTSSYVYGRKYGIRPKTLRFGAICKTSKGEILVGNINGFYTFFPGNMTDTSKALQIYITDLFIKNLRVFPGKESALTEPIEETQQLSLKYNQDNFSFNFAAIDYRSPEANRYYTMLENYDSTWREAGGDKNAFYLNIPPGKYVFRVKGINVDGVQAEKMIQVIIEPPWWKTWWAYVIYGLLVLTASLGIHRFQQQRTINRERQKAQVKELAQAKEIEKAYHELRATQSQLIQSEKMASLGELTAGIAHEIQNPLNFVNNFSEVNNELLAEMKEEIDKGKMDDAKSIADDVIRNGQKILNHGKRADAIVKGMLQHSRSGTGQKEPADINALADEYLRLAYHGFRAKDKSFNAALQTDFDKTIGNVNIVPQDIGRVLLNLYNNAFYAVMEKNKAPQPPEGGVKYEPTITVSTRSIKPPLGGSGVEIKVTDNGGGIPQKVIDKIFQPFFTTKPSGQGTGLGLSLSYDIVKAHGGELKVMTNELEYTAFIIQIPA
jgi:signal transduction histidine kinase